MNNAKDLDVIMTMYKYNIAMIILKPQGVYGNIKEMSQMQT